MLFDAASIHAVVHTLKSHYASRSLPPLVCDPVCVSTSGHTLLAADAVEVMISELFPLTYLVTPNKSEAELILSRRGLPARIESLEEMLSAARHLLQLGPQAVLLKGGHLTVSLAEVERVAALDTQLRVVRDVLFEENMEILQVAEADPANKDIVVDVLHSADVTTLFIRPRIDSTSTHGTGCTLSAAVVCGLSRGEDRGSFVRRRRLLHSPGTNIVETATRNASLYTHLGIETAYPIGKGFGPLNHMHALSLRSVPR